MLLRLRWFALGLIVGFGSWAWLAIQVRRARLALTPTNMARVGAHRVADALDVGSERLAASR